jgi:hypothetical protein
MQGHPSSGFHGLTGLLHFSAGATACKKSVGSWFQVVPYAWDDICSQHPYSQHCTGRQMSKSLGDTS